MNPKLSDYFNLDLNVNDINNNPHFARLLSALAEHISPDGVSQEISEFSIKAKSTLTEKKEVYLNKLILYNEVRNILMERKFDQTTQTTDRLWNYFIESNVRMSFNNCKEDVRSLFEDDTHPMKQDKHLLESDLNLILSKLESRLRTRCEIASKMFRLSSTDDEKSTATSNLLNLVRNDLLELKTLRETLKEERSNRIQLFNQLYECLMKCNDLLTNILGKYRLNDIPKNNTATINWLVSHCDALSLKIRMSELQLLHETYNKESLKALLLIKGELDRSKKETDKDTKQVTNLLKSYDSMGEEFQSIVKEFTRVTDSIENCKWALNQLN